MENTTHVAVQENKKPATPIEQLKSALANNYLKQVTNYYGGNKKEALRFMTASVEYVRKIPKLLQCDSTSLMLALVQVAQYRFMPSGVSGEAYIIPYGKEANFQLGYQGIVTLLYRTNRISTITSNLIHKNDEFNYQEGIDATLVHKPAFGRPKGEVIGVYTIVTMKDGNKTFKVMDIQSILAIKNLSKAKESKESPWNSDKDPEKWMFRKTCLIQHAKLLPKTEELQKAIELDYEGEGFAKPHLDPAGPGVGAAFHEPEVFCDHGNKVGNCQKCKESEELNKIGEEIE